VSVIKEPSLGPDAPGNLALVAGPFADHAEALRWVDPARRLVLDRYNPDGRADWYGYGTTAMAATYETPGRLNDELGVTASKEA
ncbi:MAG: hypothetical protein Q8S13_12470, partial [Dehalococcoidia bacterium]|nr:hypothetical protein [Dehalococcoidia bacterium]